MASIDSSIGGRINCTSVVGRAIRDGIASRRPPRLDACRVRGCEVPACQLEIVVRLEAHPEFRAITEVETEPERGVGGNTAAVVDDLGDAVRRDADLLGKPVLR